MVKLLTIFGIFCVTSSLGQTFENIRILKDEDRIIIIYDLVSIDRVSNVMVRVFSSVDDYTLPLSNVSGDVGAVLPGPNKRIIWQAGEAIANNFLDISFRFKSETIKGWKIISPTAKGMRRGMKNTIQWQGGEAGSDVNIQLIKPGLEYEQIIQTKNTGSFVWDTPKNLKPGNGYAIRISTNNISIEHRFSIKRKFPLIYYGIPAAGLVIILVVITRDTGSNSLPDAPLPN